MQLTRSSLLRSYMLLALAAGSMGGEYSTSTENTFLDLHGQGGGYNPKTDKVIPKGCQAFYFDIDGNISDWRTKETVFICVAVNLKNAARKFANWHYNFLIKSLLGKFFTYKNFKGEDIKFKVHGIDELKNGIVITFPDFDNHWECRGLNDFIEDFKNNKFTPCN